MVEYIDREKLIAEYDRVHIGVAGGARKLMVDAPTEDVVPVVRCKDCKYFEVDEEDELGECKCGYITVSYNGALYPHRTDFCNYGERKADNG